MGKRNERTPLVNILNGGSDPNAWGPVIWGFEQLIPQLPPRAPDGLIHSDYCGIYWAPGTTLYPGLCTCGRSSRG